MDMETNEIESILKGREHLLDLVPQSIMIGDLDRHIIFVNRAFEKLTGYAKPEVLGRTPKILRGEGTDKATMRLIRKHLDQGLAFHGEILNYRKDGSTFWNELSIFPVHDENGKLAYFFGAQKDITERKAAAERTEIALKEFHVLLEASGEGFWRINQTGHIIECNEAYCQITGHTRDEIIGAHISQFDANEKTPVEVDRHIQHIREWGYDHYETRHFHRDGRLIDFEIFASFIRESGYLIAFLRDVSKRKLVEGELRIAAITFDAQDAVLIADKNGNAVRVNQAFQDVSGYSAAEVVGRNPRFLQSGRHDADFYRAMWQTLGDTGKWSGEIWDKRRNGEIYPKWMTITAIYDEQQQVEHYVAVARDISASKKSEEEIHRLAFYDPLTSLPNRRLLMDRLRQAQAVSERSGQYGALMFLDLDHFKKLNDTRGHDVGDLLLLEVAKRMQSCVREGDSVARLGGDEFVVMLESLSNEAGEAAIAAQLVAEKIGAVLAESYLLRDSEYHTTASIGINLIYGHQEGIEELLKHADIAMYQAKTGGRNAIRFFNAEMQSALEARMAMESDLRNALSKQQLHLYYQVQVHSLNGILGAEVLLRWIHPERGMVSPAEFIPLAEENGLIIPIGLWVLQTACAQLRVWQDDPLTRDLILAVNVSAKQFHQSDFFAQVQRVLQESGAHPSRLKLELTESIVLDNVEDTISRMHALKSIGVSFSMDDFGTGYSSLSYLKRLPLDQIKIDRSFVRDIASDPNDEAIAQTIVAMSRALGLNAIAEGVENDAQHTLLYRHGCNTFQGYLFGRPKPLVEFEQMLRDSQFKL